MIEDKKILKVQGDIYFVKINSDELPKFPTQPISQIDGKYILAKGEKTGHAHVIEEKNNIKVYEEDGFIYIINQNAIKVEHEEHKPITLEPGIWKVGKQREYDPFINITRAIYD